ncbi:MAG: polysaccharide biosynthesis C-terminal domain-containing protein [Candidatus Riflebacteria bacterium]|nr:polysaccharide biosynthesis C-terminal domain-containing protein [Candidatus Riflebacteria bacterium]
MAQTSRTRQFALNAAGNYLRFGVALLSVFFLTPIIISSVGKDDYGLWTLINSALGILGLLDLGFGNGIIKYTAECKGSGDLAKRNKIISTLFVVYSMLSVFGTVIICIIALYFTRIFDIPVSQTVKSNILLWIVAGRSVIAYLPLSVFRGILFGEQQIFQINVVQIFSTIFNVFLVIVGLKLGYGIVFLAVANFLALILEHLVYIFLCHTNITEFELSIKLFDRKILWEVFSFSGYSFIISVSALILLRTDPLIVKMFMPLSAVSIYSIALKIAENALLLIKQYVNILGPLVAELKGSGDEIKIRFILVNCAKFAFAPAALMATASLLYSREGLSFWIGKGFEEGAGALNILMLAMALSVPQMVASSVLGMTGEHKFTAAAALISIIVNVGFSIALAIPLQMNGVAWGTFIAVLIVDIIFVGYRASKIYKIPFISYNARILLPGTISSLIFLILGYSMKYFYPPGSLLAIFLQLVPPSIIFAMIFWYFFVEASEKELFATKIFRLKKA